MTRFRLLSAASSSLLERSESENEEEGEDDADDVEPPHPLGFPPSTCRYGLGALDDSDSDGGDSDDRESLEGYMRRAGYAYPYFQRTGKFLSPPKEPPRRPDDGKNAAKGAIVVAAGAVQQQYPPLTSYVDPNTAPTTALVRWSLDSSSAAAAAVPGTSRGGDYDYDDCWYEREVDGLRAMLASLSPRNRQAPPPAAVSASTAAAIAGPYLGMKDDEAQVRREVEKVRRMLKDDNEKRVGGLAAILRREEDRANRIRTEQRKVDDRFRREAEERDRAEEERRRAEEAEADRRRERELKQRKDRDDRDKAERERAEKERADADAAAREKTEYVTRANKLVAQLVQLRASVEPFEKSTDMTVKKRRLQMKKLVNGKINTLTENVDRIRSVAAEVSQAIATARHDDDGIKQALAAASGDGAAAAAAVTPEMGRGKRYLVDLLSSKVVVRVQAEGFNGCVYFDFSFGNIMQKWC